MDASGILKYGGMFLWLGMVQYQLFKMLNCLRGEEHVGTYVTDICWDMLKHQKLGSVLYGMDDEAVLVFARASLDTAVHDDSLSHVFLKKFVRGPNYEHAL